MFPAPTSATRHLQHPHHLYAPIGKAGEAKFWFHGMRNSFITVAERELMLPPSLTKRLVNHARPKDVTQGYAADWNIAQLRDPRSASPIGLRREYPLDTSNLPFYIVNKEARMTTFYEFTRQFPDDESCLKHIMVARYGGTELDCPKCGEHGKFYRLTRDRAYLCQHCKHHIYPCVGTPMERSRTPVHKWFYAMYLFTATRHGVSAKELQRQLGVTYKTAWRMAHEIRKFMAEVDGETPLGGVVEADETLVGGKVKGQAGATAPTRPLSSG